MVDFKGRSAATIGRSEELRRGLALLSKGKAFELRQGSEAQLWDDLLPSGTRPV